MKINSPKKNNWSTFAIIISLIFVLYTDFQQSLWNNPNYVIVSDVISYYSYLPAIFVYNDVSLSFIDKSDEKLSDKFWPKETPTGGKVIVYSSGMALIYLPFFLTAHFLSPYLDYPSDGYSVPYRFALVMGSLIYLLIGLLFLRKFLLKYFSQEITAITILVLVFGTNLFLYTTMKAPMTHTFSFALIAAFLYFTDRWHENSKLSTTLSIGLLAGIISLIRPTNVLVGILFILWQVTSWKKLHERVLFLLKKWPLLIVMIMAAIIIWIPQFLYWKLVAGQYFYYSYPDDQGFFFTNPQILNVLFSWRKGFITYVPIMSFALIGFGILYKQKKELFWPVTVYFLSTLYVVSSWWDWWYGGGLSMRPLIDSYSILAIGIATFLTWLWKQQKWLKVSLFSFFIMLCLLGYKHNTRYYGASIHWAWMTREAYFDAFWTDRPSNTFYKKLRRPDYKLAKKGIYKYEDESNDNDQFK